IEYHFSSCIFCNARIPCRCVRN
ncbi:hypothetical protein A5870_002569, partial [Enterococcus sp. 2G9_DIV0600]